MATMGLLSSSLLGSIFIFVGRTLGISDTEQIVDKTDNENPNLKISIFSDLRTLLINLGFVGLAISFGVSTLNLLRYISNYFGEFSKEVILSLPVFPLIPVSYTHLTLPTIYSV